MASERGVFVGPAKLSGLAAHLARGATLAHATLLVTTAAARVQAFLTPAPPDSQPLDSRRSPVLPLCELVPGVSVPAARGLVLTEAAERYGPLTLRPATTAETCWQERLLAQRYRKGAWHTTGRAPTEKTEERKTEERTEERTEEAQWTTKPGLTCTA